MYKTSLSSAFDKAIPTLIYLFIGFSLVSIAGTNITLGFITGIWIIQMVYNKRWLVVRTPLDIAFALFFLTYFISTIFSIRPGDSLVNLKNLLLIGVVYIVSSNLREEDEVVRAIDILVFVATIMAAFGLLSTDIMGGQRVLAVQSTTMTWGAMSVIFTPITLSLFLFGRRDKKRWLYMGAFVVQFVSMLFSYVRGAWLGFVAGLFVLGWIRSKKLLLGGLVLVLIVFFLVPTPVKNRITSIPDLSVGSVQVRFTQWSNSVKIFKDYPITGVGWIDLNDIHKKYAPPGADLDYQAYRIGHFHNNFVMFLVCFGLLGFAAGLYMIFRLFYVEYGIYRQIPSNKVHLSAFVLGGFAALTGFWVNGLFDWTFGDAEPVTLLWITVGLSLAIDRMVTE